MTTTSALAVAAAASATSNPAFFAFAAFSARGCSPTTTSIPLSLRLFACACPWLPYPRIAILFLFSMDCLASFSR